MGGFLLWRLRSSISLPSVLVPACVGIVLVAIVAAVVLVWRARRRRLGWDGGALSLVLAGLQASSAPPRSARAAVWPGRPTRVGRRVRLAASADAREPGECEAIGIVGAHASQCALWCAGQIAAQLGGARVWWNSAAPVLIGNAGVDIHVSDRDSCPHCTRDAAHPTLHIGYSPSLSLLPAWCAQVCVTDDAPVSSHWWWTVTRADAQDSLPARLDWDPSSARGRGGGLSVRIGLGEEGPVNLDLVADGRIHPARIEEVHARSIRVLDERIRAVGNEALLEVGIADLHPELIPVVGSLAYRTSFGQNVLAHLIECSHLAGIMAAELGLDVAQCKRAAFLHDIGKALTHESEGPHAIIGADLLRRHGEHPDVVHAVEAHHNEVEPRTVEAILTQAADAISGSRPGARRESLEAYVERMQHLESIAMAHEGVTRAYAMQAGREVRIMVAPEVVDDAMSRVLAREIAAEVEANLTYPGQIRITVVRESRATELAH